MGKIFKFLIVLIFLCCNTRLVFAKLTYNNTEKQNLFFKTNEDIKIRLSVSDADVKTFNKSVALLEKGKWEEALSWADSIKSENLKEAMVEYVLWKKYSKLSPKAVESEFSNLIDFILTHQYLPNISSLKGKAENMYVDNKIPYQFVENYFNQVKPISTRAMIYLLKDKLRNSEDKNNPQLVSEIVNSFYTYNFKSGNLNTFLATFGSYLNEGNYAHKVEELLWKNDVENAEQLIKLLGTENRTLYSGIIEINKNPRYINNILRSIPKNLRKNELLLYTRFMYEYNNKNSKDALKILLSLTDKTRHPEKWWVYQKFYARKAIKNKNYSEAYFLTVNTNLPKNSYDYVEAQWMAGWVALSFLKDPKTAYYHFYNMYNNAEYPINKSSGAYWAGRAMEEDGNNLEAIKWYDIASKYSIYFYGQLSLHAKNELLNIPSLTDKSPLPQPPTFTKEEEELALDNNIVKLAYLMAKCGDSKVQYSRLFLTAINSAKTKGEMSAIFEIIKNTEDERLIMQLAEHLTYKDVYFVDNLFPVLNIINFENPNSNLVHSIIKQETGFRVSAESPVGATGFMQLMPSTAKSVAQAMNLKYNEVSLKRNPAYNILLGSYYINSLIKDFDGSQILAIASYNAGPSAVRRWMKNYGDPRKMSSIKDIVDWIELIEYSETRNYVQRIIESSIVYEYILEKINLNLKNFRVEENVSDS